MDLVDHIEYIAGPGSSIYGANAMLGVINVISKKGADIKSDLYQARAAHNLESKDTLLAAKDDQDQLTARIASADGAIRLQKDLISALVGAGPDRGISLKRPQLAPASLESLPANVPVQLLGRRPDIVAARLRVEAQNQGLKYAKADFYPNVNLSAFWGIQGLSKGGLQNLTASGSDIGSIGPAISLPLFHQTRLTAEYRGYEADYNTAVATYDETLTTALQEVADAASRTQATAIELASAKERRNNAQGAYELSKARWGKGLGTKIDVLTAHAHVIAAESALSDAQAQAYDDRIKFIAALGGGFKSE